MDDIDLVDLVSQLRREGSDTAGIEVKRAAGGFPTDLASTLSALTNRPGGGIVVLGLDEADDFAAVGVYDVAECQKALASLARNALTPPVAVELSARHFEGAVVVVARVWETASSEKPCTVSKSGKAYLRGYDGDYELSQAEVQAFIGGRSKPTFDRQIVAEVSLDDLEPDLVRAYLGSCRETSSQLARLTEDRDVLVRTKVLRRDGSVTLAGLLALGQYPQEWYPSLVVQASADPGPGDAPGTRVRDLRRFDGPIPVILEEAVQWVRRNTGTRVVFGADGHGRDVPEYPTDAVRELLANALVHRDLGAHAVGKPITLRVQRSRMIVANPGGLWSITADRLGSDDGPPARRNEALVSICQNARTPSGRRVIEGLGTGIRTVLARLDEAGMTRPKFDDQGIAFTVLVPNHALLDPADVAWLASVVGERPASDVQRHVLATMRHGAAWTNRRLREQFPMDSLVARTTLQGLVDMGLAQAQGERGSRRYVLADPLRDGREHAGTLLESLPQPHAVTPAPDVRRGAARTSEVLSVLAGGELSRQHIVDATGLSRRQVEYALAKLVADGRVQVRGGRGHRGTTYSMA